MSATNYRNRWVDMVVNFLITFIPMFLIYWFGMKDAYSRDLTQKVNNNSICIEAKADKTYVDTKIEEEIAEYEIKQSILIDGLKEVVSMGNENIEKMLEIHLEHINKRMDRLEENR